VGREGCPPRWERLPPNPVKLVSTIKIFSVFAEIRPK
jgi:hypothetical protein